MDQLRAQRAAVIVPLAGGPALSGGTSQKTVERRAEAAWVTRVHYAALVAFPGLILFSFLVPVRAGRIFWTVTIASLPLFFVVAGYHRWRRICPLAFVAQLPTRLGLAGERRRSDGELAAAISNTVVRALARTTGRGPTKARTTLGDNGVFVVLQDTLTRGEQTLTDAGEGLAVLDLRRRWQRVMQADVSREIEQLTGRKVIGFMSDNNIDPDLAVEVFILEPLPTEHEHPSV